MSWLVHAVLHVLQENQEHLLTKHSISALRYISMETIMVWGGVMTLCSCGESSFDRCTAGTEKPE